MGHANVNIPKHYVTWVNGDGPDVMGMLHMH